MADIRIKDLASTATTTASDDFMAVDGTSNGTRKMSAATPAFLTSVTTPSLTSPAATNLTLGTGTFGTALTVASATGNVMIGAGSAQAKLDVKAAGTSVGSLESVAVFQKSSAGGGALLIRTHDSQVNFLSTYLVSAANVDMSFTPTTSGGGQTEAMRIQASTGTVSIASSTAGSAGAGALVVTGGLATGAASYIGGALTVAGTGTEISGAGYLRATSGFSKTDTSLRNIAALSTNEAAGSSYKLLFSVTGDATAASRIFDVQTSNEGVSNSGVLRLQNLGGSVSVGGAATFAGAVSVVTTNVANPFIINSTSANLATLYQLAGVSKLIVGVSAALNGINNGSVLGDPCFRTIGNILFSTDDGTTNALKLTASTGAATFAGAVTANGQLIAKGTATNDSAAAGYIGEFASSTIASASAVSLTTNTAANVTSISLTAGDWDVYANGYFNGASATVTEWLVGISTTSASIDPPPTYTQIPASVTSWTDQAAFPVAMRRVSIASTTTIYLVSRAKFSAGTQNAFGGILARRVR